jgi:hypothetical protein
MTDDTNKSDTPALNGTPPDAIPLAEAERQEVELLRTMLVAETERAGMFDYASVERLIIEEERRRGLSPINVYALPNARRTPVLSIASELLNYGCVLVRYDHDPDRFRACFDLPMFFSVSLYARGGDACLTLHQRLTQPEQQPADVPRVTETPTPRPRRRR